MNKSNSPLFEVNNQRQQGNYSADLISGPWLNSGDTIGGKEQAGGGLMDPKYATKEELKTLETKIDGKFETLDATLTGNFKTAKAETESQFSKLEARQTKWFIGTAIAVISIVVALIKLI